MCFVSSFVRSFCVSFVMSLFRSFVLSFFMSFLLDCLRSFVLSLFLYLVLSVFRSVVPSFVLYVCCSSFVLSYFASVLCFVCSLFFCYCYLWQLMPLLFVFSRWRLLVFIGVCCWDGCWEWCCFYTAENNENWIKFNENRCCFKWLCVGCFA